MSDKKLSDDNTQETKLKPVLKTLAKTEKIKNTNEMTKPIGGRRNNRTEVVVKDETIT